MDFVCYYERKRFYTYNAYKAHLDLQHAGKAPAYKDRTGNFKGTREPA